MEHSTLYPHVKLMTLTCAIMTMFAILPSAAIAQGTLFVEGDRVGIGTPSPGGNLHIFGTSNSDVFNAIGPDATTDAFNFGYSGSTFGQASGFFNVRPTGGATAPNPALYFMTNNVDRVIIDNEGFIGVDLNGTLDAFNPAHPIHAQNSGARLTTAGVWANGSSRALKENIHLLSLDKAKAALMELEPVEFNYKVQKNDPQVGFIAEDVPDLVAMPDRKTLAPAEIVAVLARVVQEQQRMIEMLSEQVEHLSENRSTNSP